MSPADDLLAALASTAAAVTVYLYRATLHLRAAIRALVEALQRSREELAAARQPTESREMEIHGQLHRQGQDGSWVFECAASTGERRSFLLMATTPEEAQAQAELAVRSWIQDASEGQQAGGDQGPPPDRLRQDQAATTQA